jgi:hypothetical protein
VVAVLEHGGEIAGHPVHAQRADRLDAGLLDRIEDGAGVAPLGGVGAVDAGVMAGEAECDRVADAAGDGDVAPGHAPGRIGQARLVAGEHRPVGGEGDLEVGRAGDGAHAAGDRPLEGLGRPFGRPGAGFV